MSKNLSLIVNSSGVEEKRVFPRFPFCFLTFKPDESSQTFEVRDISSTGMQLCLKDGELNYTHNTDIKGHVHWFGDDLELSGRIKWLEDQRMGIEFSEDYLENVYQFFSNKNLAPNLKLIQSGLGIDLPPKLRSWLHCDGPVDCFIWQHGEGSIESFQFIRFNSFVEWDDKKGLRTGRVLSKRHKETPLVSEDEVIFQIDHKPDIEKIELVKDLIASSKLSIFEIEIAQFIILKLS